MPFGSWSIPQGSLDHPDAERIMKMSRVVFRLVAAGLIAVASCKKAEPPAAGPAGYFGVNVDLSKLDTGFTSASPEVQRSVSLVKRYYYYSEFPRAAAELDQLANDPSLSDAQKKLVADLAGLTAQVIAKAPPPPPEQ
jgi:hypothetical protein